MHSQVTLLQLALGWGIHDERKESSGESGRKGVGVKNDGMKDEHGSKKGDNTEESSAGEC